jgi:hypothetical protein
MSSSMAVIVAWRFDAGRLQRPAQPVHDERRECVALHIVGDDQQRPAALCDTLEHRKQIFHARDVLFMDENVRGDRILAIELNQAAELARVRRGSPALRS